MNTNRQKLATKNSDTVRSCSKHSKNIVKLTENNGKQYTHTPSIRCHEEVIGNITETHSKPEYYTCEMDMPCNNEYSKNTKKSKSKENLKKKKSVGHESSYKKYNREYKDTFHHFQKSKSVPVVQKPNFEDSVDFIPVKLTNKVNGFRRKSPKHEHKVLSETKTNRNRGPTWDQLLKGESNITLKNNLETVIDSMKYHNPPLHHQHETANKDEYQSGLKTKHLGQNSHNIDSAYKISISSKLDEAVNNNKNVSDPVKTLDILIEKLREKILKQPQNDNLNKIISDMENALTKIFPEQPKTTEPETCSSAKSSTAVTSEPSQSDTKQSTIAEWDIPSLKKNLEESCLFLQSLCIKQRENCTNHIREKEQLSIQLAESRRLVAVAKSREKDYEKAIGELRLKLQEANTLKEQQSKSVEELNNQIAKLRSENDTLGSLNARLKECSAEKEMLQSKLYLKDLEIEKLKVLLEVKQSVTSASKNKEKFEEGIIEDELKLGSPQDDKATLFSLPSESSLGLCKPRIICSSQASSSPRHSPSPYNSWQHISSIPQDLTEINELRNSMVRVFNIMKADTEWCDSLELELEEPLAPSFFSEDDDEVKPKDINFRCGSMETLSS